MTEIKDLVKQIREHEASQTVARKSNERALPSLKLLLMDIQSFNFGKEDMDLKQRMEVVAEQVNKLDESNISKADKEKLRKECAEVLEELVVRYKGRMEAHASRQNSI